MVPKLRLLLTTVFVVTLSLISAFLNAQTLQNVGPVTVITDKPDYAPRSNAVFTGTGFKPYEDVQLKVKNLFRACNTVTADSSYLPWTVKADANGGFVTNWTVCDCPGDSLRLKAYGITSGYIAYAYFKDAYQTQIINISPSNGVCNSTIQVSATLQYRISGSNPWVSAVDQTITFTLGSNSVSAKTNSSGIATANITVPVSATQLKVDFAGSGTGPSALQADSEISSFTTSSAKPTVTISQTSGTNPTCAEVPVTFTATATNTGGGTVTYTFKDGSTILQSGPSNTFTTNSLASGQHTISCEISISDGSCLSANSASSSAIALNVVSIATPTVTAAGYTTVCQGSSVSLSSSAEEGNQWYKNGTPIQGATDQTYLATESGSYTVAVTNGDCSSAPSTAVPVTVHANPVISVQPSTSEQSVCVNGTATALSVTAVPGSGSISYQWYRNLTNSNSGGTQVGTASSYTPSTGQAGTFYYYVVVSNSNGCSVTSEVSGAVTVTALPTANVGSIANAVCFSAEAQTTTVTYSAVSGNPTSYSIDWNATANSAGLADQASTTNNFTSTSGTISGIVIPAGLAAGNYSGSLTIMNEGGCVSVARAISVMVKAPYTVEAGGPTSICQSVTQTSIQLTGASVGSGATRGTWSIVSGGGILSITGEANNPAGVYYTPPVNYTGDVVLRLTTNDPDGTVGCSAASDDRIITVHALPAKPTISVEGSTTICSGGNVILTSSAAEGNQWYINNAVIAGATAQTYTATEAGNYTVMATVNSCSSPRSDAITVSMTNAITANAGPDQSEVATMVTLAANDPSPAMGQWTIVGEETDGSFGDASLYNTTFTGTPGKSYTLRWTVTNAPCPPSYDDVTITLNTITTTTTIAAATTTYGNGSVNLVANVTPTSATGTVEFYVGGVLKGTSTLSSGFATYAYSLEGVDAGSYELQVKYLGHEIYIPSESITNPGMILSVLPRPITVTVDAGQTKVYGTADPLPFAYTVSGDGLASGDEFAGVLNREGGENVGSYTIGRNTLVISKGGVDVTANYTLTYVNTNKFTITARPITVTVDAGQFKYCGQANPVYNYTFTQSGDGVGLATGDVFDGALTRNGDESVGNYSILLNGLSIKAGSIDKTGNYNITYQGNTFAILGVTIDASASGNSFQYGTPAKLSATVNKVDGTPVGSGVNVIFTVTATNGYNNTFTGVTNSAGIAEYSPLSGLAVNLYKVIVTTGEGCGNSTPAYLSVYDPNGAFVTGGGWINSPAGAYKADLTLTGKANFGFNAQYKKGSNTPTGNTEFQFTAGNLNFKSTNYSTGSLVVAGAKAIFKGTGTINGAGNYGFMVSGIDGQVSGGGGTDKFRIKIWIIGGDVVYDNEMDKDENLPSTTILGGGSIVIHDNSKTVKTVITTQQSRDTRVVEEPTTSEFTVKAFPNPTTSFFNVQLQSSDTKEKIVVRVLDVYGRPIEVRNNLYAGQTISLGSNYRPGMYIVEMIQGKERKQVKVLKQPD